MLAFLLFVVGVLVVGGLLFLAGSLLLGRGETQPPAELDRSPVELPDDRPVTGDDVRALRIAPALRGYRMTEVDWLLDQFAQALDERDEEIAGLRARLAADRPTPRPRAAAESVPDQDRPAGDDDPASRPDADRARPDRPADRARPDRPADEGEPPAQERGTEPAEPAAERAAENGAPASETADGAGTGA